MVPLLLRGGPTLVITHDAMLPPAHGDDGRRSPVLVLSSDPLAAALLGAAIELAGLAPRYPKLGESPRIALLRVRPRLVVIDCDHEDGCSEAFIGPALMTGSQVVLFRSRRTRRDMSEMAGRLGLRTVEMPQEHEELTSLLRELVH
ncbi:MAG: hypothetical protein JF589_02795 [Gemmatimonadetes bacterium]|nr:hypothetical protein [Gemmatimonadota bacterium]